MNDEIRQLLAHALRRSKNDRVREGLARCASPSARLEDIYAASDLVMQLVHEGSADAALADTLGKAINLALARAERTEHLGRLVVRREPARVPVASWNRPALLCFERAAYDGEERELTFALPPAGAAGDTAEAAAAAFFEPRPEVPVRPEVSGRLVELAGDTSARPRRELHAEVVAACADNIAMLARHRDQRPFWERPENEQALLANMDAIGASGGHCVRLLVEWWRKQDDPWKTWAAVFALASFSGTDALAAIACELGQVPADAAGHVETAADALLVAPHPHIPELAQDLAASPNPVARAIGIEVLGHKRLLSPELVLWHARDPNLPVLTAALRSSGLLARERGVPLLLPFLHHRAPAIVWCAARQLTLWGRLEPYREVRQGRCLPLGCRALEVLVLCGDASDVDCFDEIVAREPAMPDVLSAVARFGDPSAWAYLLHHLSDPELAGAAARALITLFGPLVPPRAAKDASAWRDGIAARSFEAGVRLRSGRPWHPQALLDESLRGDLDRRELQARLDELAVRAGARIEVDLTSWSLDLRPVLESAMRASERSARQSRPGSWDGRPGGD
jgi:hypothetical protein